jgi:hypothetical protein
MKMLLCSSRIRINRKITCVDMRAIIQWHPVVDKSSQTLMKRVLIAATTVLALLAAPAFARSVPTFAMPVSAVAVALSANAVVSQFDTASQLGAAPHQILAATSLGQTWTGGSEARSAASPLHGTKPQRATEISVPMLLAAGAVVLLLTRRRRVNQPFAK